MKVLVVEHEPLPAETLALCLAAEGFVVVTTSNGVDGLWEATENRFDVVVLDITLPGLNGYEVLRHLRARDIWTPVLVLSAKAGDLDQTEAFDLGADDYVTKPFSLMVLVARLRALTRRGTPPPPAVLTAGTLSLDPARHIVRRGSVPIELTLREFRLLEYLLGRKDTVVTKAEILHQLWDSRHTGGDNLVEVYISYLRRKVDAPFGTNSIKTVRGIGYVLDSDPPGN